MHLKSLWPYVLFTSNGIKSFSKLFCAAKPLKSVPESDYIRAYQVPSFTSDLNIAFLIQNPLRRIAVPILKIYRPLTSREETIGVGPPFY